MAFFMEIVVYLFTKMGLVTLVHGKREKSMV